MKQPTRHTQQVASNVESLLYDNSWLPLIIFMWPTHHTYMVQFLWKQQLSRQTTDPVDHQRVHFYGTPCAQQSQKLWVAGVKSLTWQYLHWTAKGDNWYEWQKQGTWSMVTVGLWRCHNGNLEWGRGMTDCETPQCTMQHPRWPET